MTQFNKFHIRTYVNKANIIHCNKVPITRKGLRLQLLRNLSRNMPLTHISEQITMTHRLKILQFFGND